MKNKFIAIFAALMMALTFNAVTSAPAQADEWGSLYHRAPDEGKDTSITVRCNGGFVLYVGEGFVAGPGQPTCGVPVNAVRARAGEEIKCLRLNYYGNYVWQTIADVTGDWKALPAGGDGKGCEMFGD
jgi:uncharacterized secreted protein with C-terminal beta-propeller domain